MFQEILERARPEAVEALTRRAALLGNLLAAAPTLRQRRHVHDHRIRALNALEALDARRYGRRRLFHVRRRARRASPVPVVRRIQHGER